MTGYRTHTVGFEGAMLRRGFWIYAWKVVCAGREVYYVGRTGDSSSSNAASPFNRISTHLDARKNAKANSLARQLRTAGLEPHECSFFMVSVGPLFPEQLTFAEHKPLRDSMAALEFAVARSLRERGFEVLGTHGHGGSVDAELLSYVTQEIVNALASAA